MDLVPAADPASTSQTPFATAWWRAPEASERNGHGTNGAILARADPVMQLADLFG